MKKCFSLVLCFAMMLSVLHGGIKVDAKTGKLKINFTSTTIYNDGTKKIKVASTDKHTLKVLKVIYNTESNFLEVSNGGTICLSENAEPSTSCITVRIVYKVKVSGKWKEKEKKYHVTVAIKNCNHQYNKSHVNVNCKYSAKDVYTCSTCGTKKTVYIGGKLGSHKWKIKTNKTATCKRAGLKTKTCKVCGEVKRIIIPKKDHDFSKKEKIIKKATCARNGRKKQTCYMCGKVRYKTYIAKHDFTKASGFKFSKKSVEDNGDVVKPTCTKGGFTWGKCKKCGVTYKILKTKPLGHLEAKEKLDEGWHYYCKREGCGWEGYKQE